MDLGWQRLGTTGCSVCNGVDAVTWRLASGGGLRAREGMQHVKAAVVLPRFHTPVVMRQKKKKKKRNYIHVLSGVLISDLSALSGSYGLRDYGP
jgi:hypothetical protein